MGASNRSTASARRDLYEILEERYDRSNRRVLTSQIPVDKWHEVIGDPTYADAILDRLVHNAHRIDLVGDSLRRTRPEISHEGLTYSSLLAKTNPASRTPQAGDIMSEQRATHDLGLTEQATSLESA